MSKVILITGASSGIGKSTAIKLLERGHIVYGAARRVDEMKEIVEKGGKALYLDVTDEENVKECVEEVVKEKGRIDVLFCNAGYGLYSTIEDAPMEEIIRQFDVNVYGTVRTIKATLPHMKKQGNGKIIITSSIAGKVSTAMLGYYAATKHALEAIGDALRQELMQLGINVVLIEPGTIKTSFENVAFASMEKIAISPEYKELAEGFKSTFRKLYDTSPGPEVVADLVVKIVESRNPKPRYRVGKNSRSIILLKRLLGDRRFDRFIVSYYRRSLNRR